MAVNANGNFKISLSNQSYLSNYAPSLGILDKIRSPLESILSPLVNGAVKKTEELDTLRTELLKDPNVERLKIKSQDAQVLLDGILIKAEAQPAKGVIFFMPGSGSSYESIANHDDIASKYVDFFKSHVGNDIDILMINSRGIGESSGTPSYEGWVKDIFNGLNELTQRGYDLKNTLLYGYSIGAWISADAAHGFCKDLEEKVAIVSDRSFSNFADVAYHYLGGGIKGYAAYVLATCGKWNANVEKNWLAVSSKSLVVYADEDMVVLPAASLFKSLQKKGLFDTPERHFILKGGKYAHSRPFTTDEKKDLGPRLRKLMSLS